MELPGSMKYEILKLKKKKKNCCNILFLNDCRGKHLTYCSGFKSHKSKMYWWCHPAVMLKGDVTVLLHQQLKEIQIKNIYILNIQRVNVFKLNSFHMRKQTVITKVLNVK